VKRLTLYLQHRAALPLQKLVLLIQKLVLLIQKLVLELVLQTLTVQPQVIQKLVLLIQNLVLLLIQKPVLVLIRSRSHPTTMARTSVMMALLPPRLLPYTNSSEAAHLCGRLARMRPVDVPMPRQNRTAPRALRPRSIRCV
jgi:hypothetical protein